MRYQDWDILLYPKGCHVPFKEFKTACYAVQAGNGGESVGVHDATSMPLLTTFVPGVPEGRHFTISLHSWTKPAHVGSLNMPGLGDRALWQIKVVVDGATVATHLYPHDCSWPQVISDGTSVEPDGHTVVHDLSWPSFYKSAVTQRNWDAADATGRIKVEVAAGFREEVGGKTVFTTLATNVCFAFFPAPIAHLQRVGIAWPNPKIFDEPLHADTYQANKRSRSIRSNDSAAETSPMRGLPMPPPPTPATSPYSYPFHDTGRYGLTMPDSANGHGELSEAFGSLALPSVQQKTLVEIRLPSDQLQKLILAMSSPKQQEAVSSDSTQMPPPPLPLHALAAKESSVGLHGVSRGSSDVSMHAGCNYFPNCTMEDESGMVVHSSPACPSSSIKGRKEGSSPTKPRDFLSTILGPQDQQLISPVTDDKKSSSLSSSSPVQPLGRKRTRSALKAFSLDESSPERKEVSARKPLRKVSRASSGGSKKARDNVVTGTHVKAVMVDGEDKENQMVVDA